MCDEIVRGDWAMCKTLRESDQQFAAVISTRRRQIAMRLLLPVIVAPIYSVFTGSFIAAVAGVLVSEEGAVGVAQAASQSREDRTAAWSSFI